MRHTTLVTRASLVGTGKLIERGPRPPGVTFTFSPEGHILIWRDGILITVWTAAEQSDCYGPDVVIWWTRPGTEATQ